jgi:hypothetical protein
MPYENAKIYGPYISKNDGRLRVIIDGKTVSYPKYLMEKHLNRYLSVDETVHHIDHNPLNNELSNLEIKTRSDHSRMHSIKYTYTVKVICYYCHKEFELTPLQQRYRIQNRHKNQKGPFCSKKCIGKYGQEQQSSN